MHNPARILIVDGDPTHRDVLAAQLASQGYDLHIAADGDDTLNAAKALAPDLVLLDDMLPNIKGIEICRRLRNDPTLPFIAIILVTAYAEAENVLIGLDAGADEYLAKPVDQTALLARVRSVLRLKSLHDHTGTQAADLARGKSTLEQRVAERVAEIERVKKLKRFLPTQIAHVVESSMDERVLASHRRDVTVLFGDLRGFSAFSELAEPEEVILVLREYHVILGALIDKYGGTAERFTADGLLVLFNDPILCDEPSLRAVQMAIEMRDQVAKLSGKSSCFGHAIDIGIGIGIAHGYATLGTIGYEGRFQYSVTGKVANLASRLCNEARNGQILVDFSILSAIGGRAEFEFVEELALKGFSRPVRGFNVLNVKSQV